MSTNFPQQADVVIIGGGVIGCSTAYHLADLGWKNIVLLERRQLTSGSTFHAAGLVGQLRSSANITQLLKHSVKLYDTLEAETGQATGWRANGGLRLACNQERWTEVKRQATSAHSFGLDMELLSPSEAKKLWPIMEESDLVGAAFLPTDGQVNPSDLTQALATGSRQKGVRIVEGCEVQEIMHDARGVQAVVTDGGTIKTPVVVNCGGIWAQKIGAMVNACVPVQACQHQYLVTEPIEGLPKNLPTLRDPDRLIYFKEEVGGLVMGGYELNPIAWGQQGIPKDFFFQLLDADWDHFESLMTEALQRVPALEHAGIRKLYNGPEAFTPDGKFILGEAPQCRGFFVGAGFNAYGIAAAGGAGKALAEWIDAGEPTFDLWPVDIRRFGSHHRDTRWVRKRTLEAYAKHYTMAWPHEENQSCRPTKTSPLYNALLEAGACFGSKFGWERPNWFAPPGIKAEDQYTYGHQNWFEAVGQEHRNTREKVTLFDESSFGKIRVEGIDASKALSWVCANDIDKKPGTLTYTQCLNLRGTIEADLTVARLEENVFYLVTGTAYLNHDLHWLKHHLQDAFDVQIRDVTSANAVIGIMGPRARQVLQPLTDDDLSHEHFAFGQCRKIMLAGADVLAMRVTFVGELGWELHIPSESALSVYRALIQSGQRCELSHAGYRAIESCRLEKGYRVWGKDVTPDDTPLEAGLGWATKLKTAKPFLGRQALEKQRQQGVTRRLALFKVSQPDCVLLGRETIYRNGEQVGYLSSGGYGYTMGCPLGLGYINHPQGQSVTAAYVRDGSYQLEIAGQLVDTQVSFKAWLDPQGDKVRT
jgi:sarcosine dehydrogenase